MVVLEVGMVWQSLKTSFKGEVFEFDYTMVGYQQLEVSW